VTDKQWTQSQQIFFGNQQFLLCKQLR